MSWVSFRASPQCTAPALVPSSRGGGGGVAACEVGPLGFVLDAEGAAVEVDGFDEGGADAAHRVKHEIAGAGIGGDGVGGDPREHLGGVGGRAGHVAALALRRGGGGSGVPHREGKGHGGVSSFLV